MVVPTRRLCTLASPSKGPVITQTARKVFPTSIPAHRSTAAQIISAFLSGTRTADIFTHIFFHGSIAHSGMQHVSLASFVLGWNCSITHPGRLLLPEPNLAHFHGRG
jgi:hypothetical protein